MRGLSGFRYDIELHRDATFYVTEAENIWGGGGCSVPGSKKKIVQIAKKTKKQP